MVKSQYIIPIDCTAYYYSDDKLCVYFNNNGYAHGQTWYVSTAVLPHNVRKQLARTHDPNDEAIRLDVVAIIDNWNDIILTLLPIDDCLFPKPK